MLGQKLFIPIYSNILQCSCSILNSSILRLFLIDKVPLQFIRCPKSIPSFCCASSNSFRDRPTAELMRWWSCEGKPTLLSSRSKTFRKVSPQNHPNILGASTPSELIETGPWSFPRSISETKWKPNEVQVSQAIPSFLRIRDGLCRPGHLRRHQRLGRGRRGRARRGRRPGPRRRLRRPRCQRRLRRWRRLRRLRRGGVGPGRRGAGGLWARHLLPPTSTWWDTPDRPWIFWNCSNKKWWNLGLLKMPKCVRECTKDMKACSMTYENLLINWRDAECIPNDPLHSSHHGAIHAGTNFSRLRSLLAILPPRGTTVASKINLKKSSNHLVGGFNPLKNMSSSVGMMIIPNIWKVKNSCSKPPVCRTPTSHWLARKTCYWWCLVPNQIEGRMDWGHLQQKGSPNRASPVSWEPICWAGLSRKIKPCACPGSPQDRNSFFCLGIASFSKSPPAWLK